MLLIVSALLFAGLALDTVVLRVHPTVAMLRQPNTWLLLVAFAVTEAVVLHVELGRNTHSVSISELTLTVALFYVPGAMLAPVRLVGGCLVLFFIRRQRPLKLMFNASLWICDVALATLVFRTLHGALDQGALRMIVPALAAALTAATIDSLAVNAVIAATSREVRPRRTLGFLRTCFVEALACSTLALVCVGAVAWSTALLVPVVISTALVMLGFRTFNSLRKQHTNVNVLYDFIRELGRDPHGDAVVRTLLLRVADLMRAERVMLYVAGPADERFAVTSLIGAEIQTGRASITEMPSFLREIFGDQKPVVLRQTDRNAVHRQFLLEYDAKDAVLAPVIGEQELLGVLVVCDRRGEVSTFGNDDGLLLQTLATHAGAALANARLVDRLNYESLHDSLTGLANRAFFQHRLSASLESAPKRTAVLLMDLDRFKEVNDTLGHHHGDLLIREIARRLSTQIRSGDLLARLGGDEFAILMANLGEHDAVVTAERVRTALGEPMVLQGVSMEVTASVGVVLAPEHGQDAVTLMQRADVAMYTAKKGYTGVQVYRAELDDYSPRRLALAGSLRSAIEEHQLSLRYQPQARMKDGVIVGAEALVRWEHPVYGEVPPDDFIGIAEQTGQIRELTRYVLAEAVETCAKWAAAGSPIAVSVNVSVRNLLEPEFADSVARLLAKHSVAPYNLTLEITETVLMADPARTTEVLRALARVGVRVSIDDFGTGYSSLGYLKALPVSELKVDKSFVRDLAPTSDDAAIIRAIVQMARALRLDVMAEGVEDGVTQKLLQDLGCDALQGYHLARPMRQEAFAEWLRDRAVAPRRVPLRALPSPRDGADRVDAAGLIGR
ncbi:MAG: putative bifunctional diguanylate cyclase/phosphodiesterase [Actinomycetes bacterium]